MSFLCHFRLTGMWKLMICLWLLTPGAGAAGAVGTVDTAVPSLTREEIHDLYSEAKSYLKQAGATAAQPGSDVVTEEIYRSALLRFLRIIEEGGIENGKLYYNVGNIYYLLGDIGRAIANYRRAERYIPLDSNLRKNLRTARLKRQDRFDLTVKQKVLKTVFFWHYDLNIRTRFLFFVVFMDIAWVLASAGVIFRRSFGLKPVVVIAAVLSGMFLCSVGGELGIRSSRLEGVIVEKSVVARKGDGEHYNPSFETPLHAGIEFKVLERRSDWWHVELPDGRTCWLPEVSSELL